MLKPCSSTLSMLSVLVLSHAQKVPCSAVLVLSHAQKIRAQLCSCSAVLKRARAQPCSCSAVFEKISNPGPNWLKGQKTQII